MIKWVWSSFICRLHPQTISSENFSLKQNTPLYLAEVKAAATQVAKAKEKTWKITKKALNGLNCYFVGDKKLGFMFLSGLPIKNQIL